MEGLSLIIDIVLDEAAGRGTDRPTALGFLRTWMLAG
jgi:hypothetical protein